MKISEQDLTQVLKYLDKTRSQITQRGREKIDANEEGIRKYNQLESICYRPNGVEIQYADSGYDGIDSVCVRLSIDELCMTHEEWNAYISEIMKEVEERRKEEQAQEREAHQERRRAKYLKLKKEFGD